MGTAWRNTTTTASRSGSTASSTSGSRSSKNVRNGCRKRQSKTCKTVSRTCSNSAATIRNYTAKGVTTHSVSTAALSKSTVGQYGCPKKLTIRMMERIPHERRITKINNITVSHKADLWFISVNYETDMSVCENQATGVVGIDLGVKTLAVCSDGLTVENPRVLRKRERRKKHLQRIVARRRKGSKNRRKSVARLARYEYHTACKRRDWLHKATRTIADENAVCFMEDLNVNGMLKNHRLAKSISDGSFNEFTRQLSYKTQVRNIDRWYPSSQICSRCGMRKPMPLSERTYECERCGLTLDRDLNAALNILHVGIANYPELMPAEGDNHLNTIGATDAATAPCETGIDHQKTA
ncbi:RNA-guided endonuclease InsQ/TnpB family protein [Bifidobacterium bifidum]|uniref:RNA-guided endonuclease InsQ/TnpB family protein n=1 Tax=Bifidobacterium bifidum TaxID=1681 RepID=UPI00216B574A|nr:transposase [Bifidobacterium bifidum]